jgi:hypothetical protein
MYHDLFLDLMYMYTYVDLAMVWMDAHTDTHTETYIHILTCIHTYIHTHIHTYIHTLTDDMYTY